MAATADPRRSPGIQCSPCPAADTAAPVGAAVGRDRGANGVTHSPISARPRIECAPTGANVGLQDLQHRLRWPPYPRRVPDLEDRPLQQARVPGHGRQQLLA